MPSTKPLRKRPELLLGAAALLLAAGLLFFMGARSKTPASPAAALTTVVLGNDPFETAAPQPGETEAAPGSYAVGYTGVAVYEQQPAATAPAQSPQQAAAAQFPVNINAASEAQLETIPGIGPVKAQAILVWRAAHGPFTDPSQLLEIKGIGDKTLAKLLPYITI